MNASWFKWADRKSIPDKDQPGIYFIALSSNDISGRPFKMIKEIIYIGMSISEKGIDNRLNQFQNAMQGANGKHGGAERVRFKHTSYQLFFQNAYVSVYSFPLSEHKNTSADWRKKGECVKHEYASFADYLDAHGELPEFNDPKKAKKK